MTAPQCSGPSLGIDIGGTKTQAVLLDASSRVIANRVRRTDRGPDGVVGGALAGNAVQNSVGGGSVRDIYRVTVQMRDGSVRAFDYQQPPQLNIGEYVRVDGNQVYRQ